MAVKPLCIDLFCGLGGWAHGLLAEGWDVVGFDIERHQYESKCSECDGSGNFYGANDEDGDYLACDGCWDGYEATGTKIDKYPAQLVLQDVLTLHGSQFRNAALIVASPPCTEFSYRGRYGRKKNLPPPDLRQFQACFRIAGEAGVPLLVENVVWAQEFVGRARCHWGSQYLWGDVPAVMPFRKPHEGRKGNHAGLRSWSAGSKSIARKAMTAELSKIPFPLAQHIARVFKPVE